MKVKLNDVLKELCNPHRCICWHFRPRKAFIARLRWCCWLSNPL